MSDSDNHLTQTNMLDVQRKQLEYISPTPQNSPAECKKNTQHDVVHRPLLVVPNLFLKNEYTNKLDILDVLECPEHNRVHSSEPEHTHTCRNACVIS